jgi:hypothetical protein
VAEFSAKLPEGLMPDIPHAATQLHGYQISGYRITRYGPNESVPIAKINAAVAVATPAFQPGDFILTHSSAIYGALIRFGEALRYWGPDKVFAHWNHAAIFINDVGDIIEALGGGVQQRSISVYEGTEYVVVQLPATTSASDRQQAVEFAQFCLSDTYGWFTIVSIALCLITGAKFGFGVDGQQICSALVARCVERIGEIFPEAEPWHLTPADLAKHFNVRITGAKGQTPHQDADVEHASKPGKRQT